MGTWVMDSWRDVMKKKYIKNLDFRQIVSKKSSPLFFLEKYLPLLF